MEMPRINSEEFSLKISRRFMKEFLKETVGTFVREPLEDSLEIS